MNYYGDVEKSFFFVVCEKGCSDIVKLLLNNGVVVNVCGIEINLNNIVYM